MDSLKAEHTKLQLKTNLGKSTLEVQNIIDLLNRVRTNVAEDPTSAQTSLGGALGPVKKSFDRINEELKGLYSALGKYGKALDKKFKDKPVPAMGNDVFANSQQLVDRAVSMHLLREGNFRVASTFINESKDHARHAAYTPNCHGQRAHSESRSESDAMQQHFIDMYDILHELKQMHNPQPAIDWSRQNSAALEARGSRLEFELCRLQYVWLFVGHAVPGSSAPAPDHGPQCACAYARSEFGGFQSRYDQEVRQLVGAMPFWPNLADSPYPRLFNWHDALEEVAASFTREFCALLGLSAASPLYIAITAGGIALPVLFKLYGIMRSKRTEWTSQNELPVEIPLPPSYYFHSIFVCPVSKEQTTDNNPPMMLLCGHVIAKDSMDKISRGTKFKCPYCPVESIPHDTKVLLL